MRRVVAKDQPVVVARVRHPVLYQRRGDEDEAPTRTVAGDRYDVRRVRVRRSPSTWSFPTHGTGGLLPGGLRLVPVAEQGVAGVIGAGRIEHGEPEASTQHLGGGWHAAQIESKQA